MCWSFPAAPRIQPRCAPEVAQNVDDTELGDLGLNCGEEPEIVAFLKTLSDGYAQRVKPQPVSLGRREGRSSRPS